MIKGIGVDLVTVSRIGGVYERHGHRFARRFLAASELQQLEQISASPNRIAGFLAKRFAAKEAAVKALGTGERQGVLLKDFSVSHDDLGKPLLHIGGQARIVADGLGIVHGHLTLSDEKDLVTAMVVLEGRD